MEFLLETTLFLAIQVVVLFAFYRIVLRPLPGQINELLFERHLKNEFTNISADTAELVRAGLLSLEAERLEAVVAYESLKGLRLNTTRRGEREALKKTVERLTRTIRATQIRLGELYAPPVLEHLRAFEELAFLAALNRHIDEFPRVRKARRR